VSQSLSSQSVCQSVSQYSVSDYVSRCVSQSVYRCVSQSVSQCVSQSVGHCVNQQVRTGSQCASQRCQSESVSVSGGVNQSLFE
jgi:hypothetical protein